LFGFALLVAGAGSLGCTPTEATMEVGATLAIVDVNVEQAAAMLARGEAVVLDIRTPEEHAAGHIAGATNLNYHAKDFAERLGGLDRDRVYVMHCATGRRSTRALELFKEQGFRNVHHLRVGFEGWKAAGQEVRRVEAARAD
jgi:rhodanese-related sulfurtransferase